MNLRRLPVVILTVAALVASTMPASATPSDQAVDRAATLKIGITSRIEDPTNFNLYVRA
jgi:hypothetical protein